MNKKIWSKRLMFEYLHDISTSSNRKLVASFLNEVILSFFKPRKMNQMMTKYLLLITILAISTGCSETSNSPVEADKSTQTKLVKSNLVQNKTAPLVSAKWLKEHLNDANLVLLDASVLIEMDETGYKSISGKDEYAKSHIPNARFADLKGNLSDQSSKKEFIMPSAEQFQKAMRNLGVNKNSHVVIYARENQSWPTRIWWMLRWAGFDKASILNGGQNAWTELFIGSENALTSEISNYSSGDFEINIRKELVADRDRVLNAISDKNITIVDSLSPAHYQGNFAMYARKGHITSAINLPSSNFVDESGYFLSIDDLDLMLDGKRKDKMITYCGGGIAASSVAFNLHRAGFSNVAVYMGSLEEWTENSENPMSIGDNP
ncbi:MAG: hypothetical protein COA86_15485 [Kangiella sp.]|nr:MAG: hypothetical protein COA86_15485 [Kangiella sp.]